MKRFVTRREAADHLTALGLPTTRLFLQKLATLGEGPPYRIYGNKSIYEIETLEAWALAKVTPERTSTSEAVREGRA